MSMSVQICSNPMAGCSYPTIRNPEDAFLKSKQPHLEQAHPPMHAQGSVLAEPYVPRTDEIPTSTIVRHTLTDVSLAIKAFNDYLKPNLLAALIIGVSNCQTVLEFTNLILATFQSYPCLNNLVGSMQTYAIKGMLALMPDNVIPIALQDVELQSDVPIALPRWLMQAIGVAVVILGIMGVKIASLATTFDDNVSTLAKTIQDSIIPSSTTLASSFNTMVTTGKNLEKIVVQMANWAGFTIEEPLDPALKTMSDAINDYHKRIEDSTSILKNDVSSYVTNPSIVDALILEGESLRRVHNGNNLMNKPAVTQMMSNITAHISHLKTIVERATMNNASKPAPTVFHLWGDTGVGKSDLAEQLGKKLGALAKLPTTMFVRPAACDFWNGYNNQTCVLFEEFGLQQTAADINQFIHISGTNIVNLNMAAIPDKNAVFTSPFIALTSNAPMVSRPDFTVVAPVDRRRDLLINVKLREGARVPAPSDEWDPDYKHLEFFLNNPRFRSIMPQHTTAEAMGEDYHKPTTIAEIVAQLHDIHQGRQAQYNQKKQHNDALFTVATQTVTELVTAEHGVQLQACDDQQLLAEKVRAIHKPTAEDIGMMPYHSLNGRTYLVTGKPGVGKTTMCKTGFEPLVVTADELPTFTVSPDHINRYILLDDCDSDACLDLLRTLVHAQNEKRWCLALMVTANMPKLRTAYTAKHTEEGFLAFMRRVQHFEYFRYNAYWGVGALTVYLTRHEPDHTSNIDPGLFSNIVRAEMPRAHMTWGHTRLSTIEPRQSEKIRVNCGVDDFLSMCKNRQMAEIFDILPARAVMKYRQVLMKLFGYYASVTSTRQNFVLEEVLLAFNNSNITYVIENVSMIFTDCQLNMFTLPGDILTTSMSRGVKVAMSDTGEWRRFTGNESVPLTQQEATIVDFITFETTTVLPKTVVMAQWVEAITTCFIQATSCFVAIAALCEHFLTKGKNDVLGTVSRQTSDLQKELNAYIKTAKMPQPIRDKLAVLSQNAVISEAYTAGYEIYNKMHKTKIESDPPSDKWENINNSNNRYAMDIRSAIGDSVQDPKFLRKIAKVINDCPNDYSYQQMYGAVEELCDTYQPEAALDPSHRAVAVKIMANYVDMLHEDRHICYGVVLGGTHGITVGHAFYVGERVTLQDADGKYKAKIIYKYKNKDAAVFQILSTVADTPTRQWPDITKHMPTSLDVSHTLRARLYKPMLKRTNPGASETWSFDSSEVGITSHKFETNTAFDSISVTYNKSVTGGTYQGQNTERGDCGSILVAMNTTVPEKLLGLHIASSPDRAFAVFIGRTEYLDVITPPRLESSNIEILNYQDVEFCPVQPVTDTVNVVGRTLHNVPTPLKTALWRTPFLGWGTRFEPAVLCEKDPRMVGESKKPVDNVIKKWSNTGTNIDHTLMGECVKTWAMRYAVMLKRKSIQLRKLTVTEALNSMSGVEKSNPIYIHSGAGYPWAAIAEENRKSCGGSGKTPYIKYNEDNIISVVDTPLGKQFTECLAVLHGKMRAGTRTACVFSMALKDEGVKLAKVHEGKTRAICGMPLDLLVLDRQYRHCAISALCQVCSEGPIKVGVNPTSLDWHNMVTSGLMVSDTGFSADYANWDGTVPAVMLEYVSHFYNALYTINDPENEKDNATRTTIMSHLVCPLIAYRKRIFQCTTGGMPSGQTATSVDNSLINSFYYLYVWMHLAKIHDKKNASPSAFFRNVSFAVYGDDNWCVIKEEVREWFNPANFAETIQHHFGQIVTSASKEGAFKWEHIADMEFLKRTFHFQDSYWTGPLVDNSLEKMLSLVKGRKHFFTDEEISTDPELLQDLAVYALKDASLGDRQRWRKLRAHILLKAKEHNIILDPFDSYVQYRDELLQA